MVQPLHSGEIAVKANVADSSDYRKLANKPILTPLAWGNVQFGSTAVYGSSGNFTVSRTPENYYRITFAASSGICPNSNKSIVSVNTLGTEIGRASCRERVWR